MPVMAQKTELDFEPCPEGLHQGVCVDVVDKGLQRTPWGEKRKVVLVWQVDLYDRRQRRFQVRKIYTLSLNDRATLRKDLESWRGRRFTEAELKGFDLEVLIGANCQLQVIHHAAEDGTVFANVQTVVPILRTAARLAAERYVRASNGAGGNGAPGSEVELDAADVPF